MTSLKLLAGAALLFVFGAAQAQYVWIDGKGVKQFSDRAPPATVPLDKILKSPRPMKNMADEIETAAPAAKPAPKAEGASVADREADYRKRMMAKAAQDKETAEKASIASQRAAACNAARAAQAQLAEGRRIRAADGSFLDDGARAEQNNRASAILQDCARTGS